MQEKQYYLKNGRLDLSLLDEHREITTHEEHQVMPYKDDKIERIFKEMGDLFEVQQK